MAQSSYEKFTWTERSPGIWERDIDEVEQFYNTMAKLYEGSGRNFFGMTGFVSISVALATDDTTDSTEQRLLQALRNAWTKLRYDHPTIGSWVEYDHERKRCKKIYQAFTDDSETASRNGWLDTTFRTVSNGQTGLEWCNSDPPVPKLPTLFVIAPPPAPSNTNKVLRRDLVIRSHHDIMDGIGTLHLLDNLLAHASEAYVLQSSYALPAFGSEYINLSPPFRVAADIPAKLSEAQARRMQSLAAQNEAATAGSKIFTIPFKRGPVLPGKHQRVAITLPTDRTTALLDACRTQLGGATVTHAFHAAIAIAVRDSQGSSGENWAGKYVNYCLVNERAHCRPPYNSPTHAASVYHSVSGRKLVVDLEVPAAGAERKEGRSDEFRRVALQMRDFYRDIRDDEEHVAMVPAYWAAATPQYPEPAVAPPVPGPNPSPSVSISSMGILDRIIAPQRGPFEMHDPWVTGEELGTGLGLFLGTWRGRLSVSAAFNDAWHDEEEVMEFLERCKTIVFQGLGL